MDDHNYVNNYNDDDEDDFDSSDDYDYSDDEVDYISDDDSYYDESADAFDGDVDNFVLPSRIRDYHPSWKKSKKTFLDVYIVAKKTKELLDASSEYIVARRCVGFDRRIETINKELEIIKTVSKKRSTSLLSNVLGLPDLVIAKIFGSIVESYNIQFDRFGPEEKPWLFEDQDQDADHDVATVCYSTISAFYEFILCIVYPNMMDDLGFDAWSKMICDSGGLGCDGLECCGSDELLSKSPEFKHLVIRLGGD